MGKRGPRPTPTPLKVLRGARKDRINQHEPKPTPGRPPMPSWLPPEAKKIWRRLAPELERMGVLTKADGLALEGLVSVTDLIRLVEEQIRADGVAVADDKHVDADGNPAKRKHPLFPTLTALRQLQLAYLKEFGGTPSSRSSLKLGGEREVNPLVDFIKGGSA